jgi:hypothetical protein
MVAFRNEFKTCLKQYIFEISMLLWCAMARLWERRGVLQT